jgi:hypothetical protein
MVQMLAPESVIVRADPVVVVANLFLLVIAPHGDIML